MTYSLKPFRFKSRGLLGILAYSLACVLAYVFLPWAWLGAGWKVAAFLTPAVFLDKWVNLHFHQVTDYDADRAGDVATYASRTGPAKARRTLRGPAWMAIAAIVAAFVFATASEPRAGRTAALIATGVFIIISGLTLGLISRSEKEKSPFVLELPAAYLISTFTVFRFFPLVLMLQLSLETPALWIVAGTALALVLLESSVFFRTSAG